MSVRGWVEGVFVRPSPLVSRMTDACKNITLPQTLFMGCSKKSFQLKANRALADRCMGYIVNKFEKVWGRPGPGQADPHVCKGRRLGLGLSVGRGDGDGARSAGVVGP